MSFDSIRRAIISDPANAEMASYGYSPVYSAALNARIAVIGQAPGRKAQESQIPWNDASGETLFGWLGVTSQQFRDPEMFALLPMDFYYPGKGPTGDLPPRRGFAAKWHPPLLQMMPEIRLTILIGTYAQTYYLGEESGRNLTETVRAFRDYLPERIPIAHPSPLNFRWQARNPWFATELLPVLRDVVAGALR